MISNQTTMGPFDAGTSKMSGATDTSGATDINYGSKTPPATSTSTSTSTDTPPALPSNDLITQAYQDLLTKGGSPQLSRALQNLIGRIGTDVLAPSGDSGLSGDLQALSALLSSDQTSADPQLIGQLKSDVAVLSSIDANAARASLASVATGGAPATSQISANGGSASVNTEEFENAVTHAAANTVSPSGASREVAVLQAYSYAAASGGGDAWKTTGDAIKAKIGSGNSAWVDSAIAEAQQDITKDPSASKFADTRPDVAAVIEVAKQNLIKGPDKALIDKVANTAGLTADEVGGYARILGGDQGVSDSARQAFQIAFANKTPSADDVRSFFNKQSYAPKSDPFANSSVPTLKKTTGSDGSTNYDVNNGGKHIPVSVAKAHLSDDGTRDVYAVTVRGSTFNVTYPKGADTTGKNDVLSLDSIARVYSTVDDDTLKLLGHRTLEVHTEKGGYLDAGADIIRSFPAWENNRTDGSIVSLLKDGITHETGHALQGDQLTPEQAQAYGRAIQTDGSAVSEYARSSYQDSGGTNVWEDFAETYKTYTQVRGTPQEEAYRQLYPARFAVLDQVIPQLRATSSSTSVHTSGG